MENLRLGFSVVSGTLLFLTCVNGVEVDPSLSGALQSPKKGAARNPKSCPGGRRRSPESPQVSANYCYPRINRAPPKGSPTALDGCLPKDALAPRSFLLMTTNAALCFALLCIVLLRFSLLRFTLFYFLLICFNRFAWLWCHRICLASTLATQPQTH